MTAGHDQEVEDLILRADGGDPEARHALLVRHRDRLRRMVALRLDRRVAARIDPSDIVQQALADADQELSDFLRRRPMPYYAWLRRYAWDRLVEAHRLHVLAGRRSVQREHPAAIPASDPSAADLAG